jgi:hypothetical protein
MKFYITGTRRGLGKYLAEKHDCVNSLRECDIFINCKHDGFYQVEMLYEAASQKKRIINIGSSSSDWAKGYKKTFRYGIEKKTLRDVNDQLFWEGVDTTIINFGFFDSPRVAHVDRDKMSIEYCSSVIDWILDQPHRVKEITVTP